MTIRIAASTADVPAKRCVAAIEIRSIGIADVVVVDDVPDERYLPWGLRGVRFEDRIVRGWSWGGGLSGSLAWWR
jgi:hypothetical protein